MLSADQPPVRHHGASALTQIITEWEDRIAADVAERLWADARAKLRAGEWTARDLESAAVAAGRRLTARQREHLWEALSWDVELARLAAGIPT